MRAISVFVVVAIVYFLIFTNVIGNGWMLLTGKGYTIPRESSVFTFRANEMNDGPGDYWIYGEDDRYYYFVADGGDRYRMYPKERAKTCPRFSATAVDTWCY